MNLSKNYKIGETSTVAALQVRLYRKLAWDLWLWQMDFDWHESQTNYKVGRLLGLETANIKAIDG